MYFNLAYGDCLYDAVFIHWSVSSLEVLLSFYYQNCLHKLTNKQLKHLIHTCVVDNATHTRAQACHAPRLANGVRTHTICYYIHTIVNHCEWLTMPHTHVHRRAMHLDWQMVCARTPFASLGFVC